METFKWLLREVISHFTFGAGIIFSNILLFTFIGLMCGLVLVAVGHNRKWFKREFVVWSLLAKLYYPYLLLLFMILGGVTGIFFGMEKTAHHFVDKAATPISVYAKEYAANIQAYLPNPHWAKENDMTLDEMIAYGLAEKTGLKRGSMVSTVIVAINVGIVEHVLDRLGVPELVRDPIGTIRVLREASYQAAMFSGLTPRLQSVCGHFIWLKYKVVLIAFLPFFLLPMGEYLLHRIFKGLRGRVSGGAKQAGNMVQGTLLLGLACLFVACGKEDENINPSTNDKSYMNAKMDGVWAKSIYPSVIITEISNPDMPGDTIYGMLILGVEIGKLLHFMEVGTVSYSVPKAGIYEDMPDCNSLSETCIGIGYSIKPGFDDEQIYSSGVGGEYGAKLVFDILEYRPGGRIKGTFSGVIVDENTGKKISVTEGEFDTFIP